MIYVVSGYMRSGISMMMQTLGVGGMDILYSDKRDEFGRRYSDEYYKVNPESLYELTSRQMGNLNFPKQYEGKLIKVVAPSLHRLSVDEYKVIFMLRNPEEIRQSYQAAFFRAPTREYIRKFIKFSVETLRNRKDVFSLIFVHYRLFLDNPLPYLRKIKQFGFNINIEKAMSVPTNTDCRFKIENLVANV